jgi:hypothetical protein
MPRGSWHSLAVPSTCQEERFWCWAAVSVSVDVFYGGASWSQCRLASAVLSQNNCCADASRSTCDRRNQLSDPLKRVGRFRDLLARPLSFSELAGEIDSDTAVAAAIRWRTDGGYHFVVLNAYEPASRNVVVNDPDSGPAIVHYDKLLASYRSDGVWTYTYRTQR